MSGSSLLEAVLAPGGLRSTLQPIFDLSDGRQRVFSVECLTRGPLGTNLERADVLFEYVRRKKEETAVDRACVLAGLMAVRTLPSTIHVNLNVHASTLGRDESFADFIATTAEACGIEHSRLVVEIVEHSPYWDGSAFRRTIEALRERGIALALDDVGTGFSNFGMMIDCHPAYLKIDRYLVQGCDRDSYRRSVLESIHRLTEATGAKVIAEGVETVEELEVLLGIGVTLVQGYLLCANRTREDLVASGLLQARPHAWGRAAAAAVPS